ncbi:nuclear envelope protein that mediates the nuclear export of importin alpha [Brettanomyces bruxellensis AWRI1499]|nr:nuclear envelope protein that mediates the nuclear export of importin alpha [Brettanomyces bruxellensis AWRI1499]
MSDTNTVVQLLAKSLQPSTAKESENGLRSLDAHQGFPLTLLNIVSSDKMDMGIRLAGALYFKNLVKRKWIDEDGHYHLHDEDVAAIKRRDSKLIDSFA